jgi:hypothetical protein
MKKLLFLLSLLSASVFAQVGAKPLVDIHARCGIERQPVKTSLHGVKSEIVPGTIHDLIQLPAPSKAELGKLTATRLPAEQITYAVDGNLVGFKLETDSDFHVVIADPQDLTKTMIVEIPSPACVKDPTLKPIVKSLRANFQGRFGKATPRFKRVQGKPKVEIVGPAFFDFLHGQTGVAPNGIEIHPVVDFKVK